MKEEKKEFGLLGKLAAVATALTAILTLVFLIFPKLKPVSDTQPPPSVQPRNGAAQQADNDVGGGRSSKPADAALDPSAALAIREVLAANESASTREATAFAPLDREPPAPDASRDSQARYLFALSEHYGAMARAVEDRLAAMEKIKLAAAPPAFRQALQTNLKEQRNRLEMLLEVQILASRAAMDTRMSGASAYLSFFSSLSEQGTRAARVEKAVTQSWAEVRAAAVAVGIE